MLLSNIFAGTPAAAAGRPYLDFGARLYDPRTAAWLAPDPLSEKYYPISPYAYCVGNPVNLVDPTGEESKPLFVQVAPVLYEVFKTIVIATAAYWGAKSVSQAIEKGDSEEYSYNPGWGWQEKRDRESRDETERIKLKHRESMNNSMGDPENHDDNNNFKNR